MRELISTWDGMARPRLLVLGDLMLDRYVTGRVERISPEAPVLVLRSESIDARLGGAASVAALLTGLEVEPVVAGIVGDDPAGRLVRKLLADIEADLQGVFDDPTRETTVKERLQASSSQRPVQPLLRVDSEARQPPTNELLCQLAGYVAKCMSDCQAVLISDYGKGVCAPELLSAVIGAAKQRQVPVLVDPARGVDWRRYRGATWLKCNRLEAQEACGHAIRTPQDAIQAAQYLLAEHHIRNVIVTLEEEGLAVAFAPTAGQWSHNTRHIAAPQRVVRDVTGAGDMALAMLGVGVAAGIDLDQTCELANILAGLEVERHGVEPVTRDEVRMDLLASSRGTQAKVVGLPYLADQVERHRRQGKRVVFTNGCFDLALHRGHLVTLQQAAALGDVLIVGVNSDDSVRRLKGAGRPIVKQQDRADQVAALDCVDYVVVFDEPTPHVLLHHLRPDVLVKGGTYQPAEVVGQEVVTAYGGDVRVVDCVAGSSTTGILHAIQASLPAPLHPKPELFTRTA